VGRAWVALGRKAPDPATPIELNGRLGLLVGGRDGNRAVLSFQVEGGRIVRIDAIRNPEKLRRVSGGDP
jgi:RNA polymerase sigma-70 factor (ECF subfamily)